MGYVYCVSFTDGVVKIGSTVNLAKRFQQLQGTVLGPERFINNAWYAECDDFKRIETMIHNSIPAHKRLHVQQHTREWYSMPYDDALKCVRKVCRGAEGVRLVGRKAVTATFRNLKALSEAFADFEQAERFMNGR